MNKKSNFIFRKKKNYKIILYLLLFITTIFLAYFSMPNFFNYTPELIEKSLQKKNDINIKNISKIDYKLFPSPRLRLTGSTLEFKKNFLEVEDAEIDIILDPQNLINYQNIDYNKLLIKGGSINVEISKVNQLLNYIKKNKKKINLKKNIIIVLKEDKKLFEINNTITQINSKNNIQKLSLDGLLLGHKIFFILEKKFKNKSNITFKIPELDISTKILLIQKNNFKTFEGLVNFMVLNNLFQFNFTKKKNITINKGYVRNNLINSSFEGEVRFMPHFFFNLDVKPSKANIEDLFSIIQKNYFSDNAEAFEIIKKINGSLNFKNMFEGNITFQNKKILFQNFKIGKYNSIFLDAKTSKLGKKGKIYFNLYKKIQRKNNSSKKLKISGFITPFSSKVTFEQIVLDEEIFTLEKIIYYEKKFKKDVINSSLNNIFNEKKINNFLEKFI
jgi:hypothetical protein